VTDSRHAPDVDYLTRDYEGFRKLLVSLLDRSPTPWTEFAAADLGVMVVEILANQLDHLGYAGDRAAEEAFLGTARRREYARRHAALGDHRLDRGNATSGFVHFALSPGTPRELPAGTQVGQQLRHGDDVQRRLVFETTAAVRLDARLGELALARSVGGGEAWVRLRGKAGARLDLRALGVRPGMRFCVLDPERRQGELITARRVQGDAVELADPLGETYLADRTVVLGNMVPVRRGLTGAWERAGLGGAARGDVRDALFFAQRIDVIRRLRAAAEAARTAWIGDPSLAAWWELACAEVACVVRDLRASGGAPRDADAKALDARLLRAAELLRELVRASGFEVPEHLRPSERVAVRHREIALPGEPPDLWIDGAETLRVRVDDGGRSTPWIEQEDLLQSGPDDPHYVVEIDEAGGVTLRFGDGVNGALLPPEGEVMVRRLRGDLFGGDLGAGALDELLGDAGDGIVRVSNPLPTTGGRRPEPLRGELVRAVQRGLARRAIPVTADDYRVVLLEQIPELAEVSVAVVESGGLAGGVTASRVDVVIRPRPGVPPAPVLARARARLRTAKLAGTDVGVRLYEPIFASIALVVEVHPELTAADVRVRLRRALLGSFGGGAPDELGRARTRAEVHAVAEGVPGVIYSQVIGFDLASVPVAELGVREEIRPERHQVVRCLGLPDNPLCGDIAMWAARRYRLDVELGYPDPDERPDPEVLIAMMKTLLSGRDGRPVREQWPALTAARIDDALAGTRAHGATHRLSVRVLMIGERAVEQVPLGEGEVPILDGIQLRERPFRPHFALDLELTSIGGAERPADEQLQRRIKTLLSGPGSVPVRERWSELTPRLVEGLLARELGPGLWPSSVGLRIGEHGVERIRVAPGDVPVLDTVALSIEGDV
jgi:hypothetical protein